MVKLTKTGMVIIIVGVIILITGLLISFPVSFGEQEDTGIFSDQFSIAESFVPFRTVGQPRTTITSSGDVVEAGTDFTGAIEALTAQQVTDLIKNLPDECRVKLFTTVVFEDDTRKGFSSGFTSFDPVTTLTLISPEGQPIKRFETVPLMTCDVIIAKDDSRIGYINQWLQGVNMNWEFIREDGTKGEFNTASQSAGGTSTAPKCTPVLFEDVGDLATAGYSTSEIQRYKETFGNQKDSIFIGSERALCATDPHGVVAEPFIIQASEIENGKGNIAGVKGEGKEFETTLSIRMTGGTIILEVPFLSDELGEPFIAREALDQFLSRQVLSFTVDKLVDIDPEDVPPPPTGVSRTIVTDTFSPTKIDVALLSESDRTVTWRIKLNSYDNSEGIPQMEIRKLFCLTITTDRGCTNIGSSLTATINFKDAGFSGTSKVFEGKWVVPSGQTLGTYGLEVSMPTRDNDVSKRVEVVQSAKDAQSTEPDASGNCGRGEQKVQDKDGKDICVAECADNLLWDLIQQACAEKAICPNTGKLPEVVDGEPKCVEDPTTGGICREGLNFNQDTGRCEGETITQIPECKDNEQLVNLGGGKTECQPQKDFCSQIFGIPCSNLFKVIACTDKIGLTDDGICVPPLIAGLFENPIQLIYVGIGFIVVLVLGKFLWNSVNRSRGGIVLAN